MLLLVWGCGGDEPPPVELPGERVGPPPSATAPASPGDTALDALSEIAASSEEAAVLEVGEDFWRGTGTAGFEIAGRFVSREALASALALDQPVARLEGHTWVLGDILVSVDYRGPRNMAKWRVAGPAPVVEPYVQRMLERAGARSELQDAGALRLEVRLCCEDRGRQIPPQ